MKKKRDTIRSWLAVLFCYIVVPLATLAVCVGLFYLIWGSELPTWLKVLFTR